MKNLSKITLKEIKEKNIKPLPRWKFVLKNYLLWIAGISSLIVGGLSTSVIIHMLINNDWDIYGRMRFGLLEFILVTLPYFWIFSVIIFIIFTAYYIRHTKKGYKITIPKITALGLIIILIFGGLLYFIRIGEMVEDVFSRRLPMYHNLSYNKEKLWMQPQKGLLIGVIQDFENNNNFYLLDLNNAKWKIISDENLSKNNIKLFNDKKIKMIGKMQGDRLFFVRSIRECGKPKNKEMRCEHFNTISN